MPQGAVKSEEEQQRMPNNGPLTIGPDRGHGRGRAHAPRDGPIPRKKKRMLGDIRMWGETEERRLKQRKLGDRSTAETNKNVAVSKEEATIKL